MSQLRFDLATHDWVIFAPARSLRPHDGAQLAGRKPAAGLPPTPASACPFCPGNESSTPREIYAVRRPGDAAANWRVRVVPNKFPALRIEEQPQRLEDSFHFCSMGGCGAHEVIVESPDHNLALAQQPVEQVELVLATLQARYRDLMRDQRFQTIVIFKNYGESAGTSLEHPHWQLIATPIVPPMLRLKHTEAVRYFERTGTSLYSVMREQELAAGRRVLACNDGYVAFLPFASHLPFETWIVPRRDEYSFSLIDAGRLRMLAQLLKIVLLKLYTGLENPHFNLTIDDVSRGEESNCFLWHMRILPRLTTTAGFELGSGMSINTVLPEDAAAFLSEVALVGQSG